MSDQNHPKQIYCIKYGVNVNRMSTNDLFTILDTILCCQLQFQTLGTVADLKTSGLGYKAKLFMRRRLDKTLRNARIVTFRWIGMRSWTKKTMQERRYTFYAFG